MSFQSTDKVCINCAHLSTKEDSIEPENQLPDFLRRGKFVCNFWKERAIVTNPSTQTCGYNFLDRKVIDRDNILNEILNER